MQIWYCVPPGEARRRFEQLAYTLFPNHARECKAFLRHKTVLISPSILKAAGIPFVKVGNVCMLPLVLLTSGASWLVYVV